MFYAADSTRSIPLAPYELAATSLPPTPASIKSSSWYINESFVLNGSGAPPPNGGQQRRVEGYRSAYPSKSFEKTRPVFWLD